MARWMYLWTQEEWKAYAKLMIGGRPEGLALKPASASQHAYLLSLNVPSAVACQFSRWEASEVIARRLRENAEYEEWRAKKRRRV